MQINTIKNNIPNPMPKPPFKHCTEPKTSSLQNPHPHRPLSPISIILAVALIILATLYPAQLFADTNNQGTVQMVPIDNPVYTVLDILEARGDIPMQPITKPYTARTITKLLQQAYDNIAPGDRATIDKFLAEFSFIQNTPGRGIPLITEQNTENPVILGTEISTLTQLGVPLGTEQHQPGTTISLLLEPHVVGQLSPDIAYRAAIGVALEKYAPDLFYESYTKTDEVHFPNSTIGIGALPYQFNYDTLWWHANAETYGSSVSAISSDLHIGFSYDTEGTVQLYNDTLTLSFNNLRRYWGASDNNLILSATARRFPGIELRLQPAEWASYSYLTGTLFYYPQQYDNYKEGIYGYDLGSMQKNYTLHAVELTPIPWLSLGLSSMNIWPKRFELGYNIPLLLPFFIQIDQSDSDNLAMEVHAAARIPQAGKIWGSLFMDEVSFDITEDMFNMPRNRIAYQGGWQYPIPEHILPLAKLSFQYTRVTPFVYTHYPEDDFGVTTYADGSIRPVDQTFTHDGFNLGFYLPPNSDELDISLESLLSPNLTTKINTKLIRHGTNNLDSATPQIFGDIYQHQGAIEGYNVYQYPLMDFTHDGIYDWTFILQGHIDWQPDFLPCKLNFGLGYAYTWWETNDSGVTAPDPINMMMGTFSCIF